MSKKQCSKCKEWKEFSEFSKAKNTPTGRRSDCKSCQKEYRKINSKKLLAGATKCRAEHRKERNDYNARYRRTHKKEIKKSAKKYYDKHKKEKREYTKIHQDERKEYDKKRGQTEKERRRKRENHIKNKEKDNEYSRKYRKEHLEKTTQYAQNKRALRANASGRGVTAKQWLDLKKEYNYLCAYCNQKKILGMDHVVPLTKGGEHDIDNIVPACHICNSRKHNSSLLIFLYRYRNIA